MVSAANMAYAHYGVRDSRHENPGFPSRHTQAATASPVSASSVCELPCKVPNCKVFTGGDSA